MNEPKVYLRGKGDKEKAEIVREHKPSDIQQWSSSEPPRPKRPQDYWSPYVNKRNRKTFKLPDVPKTYTYRESKGGQAIIKLVITCASAILVGLLMGFFILKTFVVPLDPASSKRNTIDAHLEDHKQENSTTTNGDTDNSVVLPGINAVWVQGGVYGTRERAESVANEIKQEGLPAIVTASDNQFRLFYGVGLNRNDALTLASHVKDSGVDVYIKDDLPIDDILLNDVGETAKETLEKLSDAGQKIVEAVSAVSIQGLNGSDLSQTIQTDIQTIEKDKQLFDEALHELEEHLTEHRYRAITQLADPLNDVVDVVKQHAEQPAVTNLWKMQESVMQYLLVYDQLREAN